jgi:hypothetical protein
MLLMEHLTTGPHETRPDRRALLRDFVIPGFSIQPKGTDSRRHVAVRLGGAPPGIRTTWLMWPARKTLPNWLMGANSGIAGTSAGGSERSTTLSIY